MTIASQTSRISYTGDGVTTAFATPFYFQANSDIVVNLQDTLGNVVLQVLGTNYNMTGATLTAGGTCTFVTAPASGYLISIYRDPPATQTTSYNNNDPFPAKSHELALDKLTTLAQRTKDSVNRAIHQAEGEASMVTALSSIPTRKNKLLGFDTAGALIYVNGPTFVNSTATGVATVESRAAASVTTFPISVNMLLTGGYATAGDNGGGIYTRGISSGLGAFQDGAAVWWNLVSNGTINLKALGAGHANGTADVAAMNAAISVTTIVVGGQAEGVDIIIPPGNYDFSTGAFLFTKNSTRLLGGGINKTNIIFNPAAPATLFTFYKAGDLTGGIGNCEISNLQISSTNAVNKTAVAIKNSTVFLIDHVSIAGFTDPGGVSVGIANQGRNFLTVRNSFIYADTPHFMSRNPDRANYALGDVDFQRFERNQLVALNSGTAIHYVSDGTNVTNWSEYDSDWALGRYGVLNVDSTSDVTSTTWTFKGIRREQERGSNPTVFAILRSGPVLRDLSVEDAAGNSQLFSLSGIDRANFENPEIVGASMLIGQADATVVGLKWRNLFALPTATISLTGQTLVRGREKVGGTNTAPIYRDATYTNTPDGTIEWIGAPSANGHRVGLWRATADVPVYNGSNAFTLLPWTLYTIAQAQITVNGPGTSGIATFLTGQAAPAGNTVLVGQTNFAVDAGAGHLSAFHFSDTNVGIVNKLAGGATVTVEVLFAI